MPRARAPRSGPRGSALADRLGRLTVAEAGWVAGRAGRPGGRVGDHPPDVGVEVRRVRLVTGPEVEDPAPAAVVAAAAPEHLAALEPAHEDELIGGGDVEELAVHFLLPDYERFAEPRRDRMRGIDHPESLPLPGFAPLEVAARSHEPAEDLRVVARVEDDQAHPVEHAPLDPIDDRIVDLVVG